MVEPGTLEPVTCNLYPNNNKNYQVPEPGTEPLRPGIQGSGTWNCNLHPGVSGSGTWNLEPAKSLQVTQPSCRVPFAPCMAIHPFIASLPGRHGSCTILL